jgi:hypothetical protein
LFSSYIEIKREKILGIILGFSGVASKTFAIKNLSMMLKRN